MTLEIKHRISGDVLWCEKSLQNADLRYADLHNADLHNADLQNADLRYADLQHVDLRYANLRCADLRYVDLQYTDLRYANLQYADLQYANLHNADLRYADLHNADLRNADLHNADLQNAKYTSFSILPDGDIVGWKKLCCGKLSAIAQLKIPQKAKRVNSTSRKCRAEYAWVLAIYHLKTGERIKSLLHESWNGPSTRYTVGRIVRPDKFDPDCRIECSHGIHFFITRAEAEAW